MQTTTAQIIFTADPNLKLKALNKAKKEGITLKALLTMAMKSYVNNDLSVSLNFRNNYYDDVFSDKEIVASANKLGKILQSKKI